MLVYYELSGLTIQGQRSEFLRIDYHHANHLDRSNCFSTAANENLSTSSKKKSCEKTKVNFFGWWVMASHLFTFIRLIGHLNNTPNTFLGEGEKHIKLWCRRNAFEAIKCPSRYIRNSRSSKGQFNRITNERLHNVHHRTKFTFFLRLETII